MGCNCGDNEYNIEIENNGDCEPTTPVYNITLGQIGVDGFSPKVNFINETSSSFQIQTIDINGEEISGVVPKLSYIDSMFLTQADATTTYLTVNGSNAANVFNIGNLRINNSGNWITASTLNSKDLLLYSTGATKVYYGITKSTYTEIATIGDISDLSNTLAPVATSGNYEDLSNKPTIPTVGNGLIVINQGGVTKGSFRLNQSEDYTLNLDAGGSSSYIGGNGITITDNTISIDTSVVATLEDIPSVNNPTITFTQGGVTKGTITLNQSTNQTIALDSGGSVTNPITLTESYTEDTRTTTGTLTVGLNSDTSVTPNLKIHYTVEDTGGGGSSSFSWDEYIIDRTLPATNGGLTATTSSTTGRMIRQMSVNVDNSTIKINGSGQLYADVSGGSYTAGTGIDITNDTISADFTEVATAAQGALADTALQSGDNISELENDAEYLSANSAVAPLSYKTFGISTTVIGSIDSNGYLEGTSSSVEAEFIPETTVASQIIFDDVFSFTSHSAWTNDAMLEVVFSEPFTVGSTTNDRLRLYVTRFGTVYFIIGSQDNIYTSNLISNSGTYDSRINLVLTFTDSGDNWTIGTGVTNFSGSTWKYGNKSGTCTFNRTGSNTATIPKTAKIKKFVLYNSTQSRVDTINTSVQIGANVYTINSDSAGLKLSYDTGDFKTENGQLCLSGNSPDINGQWVGKYLALATGETLPDTTDITYNLSSYLPTDASTYRYKVLLDGTLSTGTTSGNIGVLQVQGLFTTFIGRAVTRTSGNAQACGTIEIVVNPNNINLIVKAVANNTGTFNISLRGYQRLGTNA